VLYDQRNPLIIYSLQIAMFLGAEVGEYFECPRFIFKASPISWAWSCCTCPR
jgi:hypothetical protein